MAEKVQRSVKAEKRKPGRPTKATPELQDRIVRFIRTGDRPELAAMKAGVCQQTLFSWLRDGARNPESPNKLFLDRVEAAQAAWESQALTKIATAGRRHWQALAWILERRMPRKYALRVRHEVDSELDEALEAIRQVLSPGDFDRVLSTLEALRARGTPAPEAGSGEG